MHGQLPEVALSTTLHIKFVTPVHECPAVLVPRVLQLQYSSLWVPDAALCLQLLDLHEIFACIHLNYSLYYFVMAHNRLSTVAKFIHVQVAKSSLTFTPKS